MIYVVIWLYLVGMLVTSVAVEKGVALTRWAFWIVVFWPLFFTFAAGRAVVIDAADRVRVWRGRR